MEDHLTRGIARDEIRRLADCLRGDDRDFFLRVWSADPGIYHDRIRAAGFAGLGEILDAGCGFGQWSLPLAEVNRSVSAIDISDVRVQTVRDLAECFSFTNLSVGRCDVEATPYAAQSFDGIFSYSVLYFTDYRKTLDEFARLLRPGGLLYLCTNGLGWYLHNLIDGHNASPTFDPAAMAVATLQNSLNFYTLGSREDGQQIVTPSAAVCAALEANGFQLIALGPEGTCSLDDQPPGISFYKSEYFGLEGVYELIARKVA